MTIFDNDHGPQILNRFGQNLGGRSIGKLWYIPCTWALSSLRCARGQA